MIETRVGDKPKDYVSLPGWVRMTDADLGEVANQGGVGFVLGSENEFGSVVMFSLSPERFAEAIKGIQHDPGLKQIVKDEIDRSARGR